MCHACTATCTPACHITCHKQGILSPVLDPEVSLISGGPNFGSDSQPSRLMETHHSLNASPYVHCTHTHPQGSRRTTLECGDPNVSLISGGPNFGSDSQPSRLMEAHHSLNASPYVHCTQTHPQGSRRTNLDCGDLEVSHINGGPMFGSNCDRCKLTK